MNKKWLENFSQVSQWTRDRLADLNLTQQPTSRPHRSPALHVRPASPSNAIEPLGDDDWEHISLERWAASVYAQVDTLVQGQKHAERIRKGGIHLLMDEDLIRQMETRLGSFEWIQVADEAANSDVPSDTADNQGPVTMTEFQYMISQFQLTAEERDDSHKDPIITEICRHIYSRGIAKDARSHIWAFLVGMYPWTSSSDEQKVIMLQLTQDYLDIKSRWQQELEKPATSRAEADIWFRRLVEDRKHRVEKDVVRTDANSSFYASSARSAADEALQSDHGSSVAIERILSENVRWAQLRDILISYATYRIDVGYVQGMSDIASAIHQMCISDPPHLFQDMDNVDFVMEAYTFWMFAHFMDPYHLISPDIFSAPDNRNLPIVFNFHSNQCGLRTRLILILYLLRIVEPNFYDALGKIDGDLDSSERQGSGATSLFWLFRSLLLLFKRDISDDSAGIYELWDGLLAGRFFSNVWMDVWIALAIVHIYIRPPVLAHFVPESNSSATTSEYDDFAPGSPVNSFESLLKLSQSLSSKMDQRRLLTTATVLFQRFIATVQPPPLKISPAPDPLQSSKRQSHYWRPREKLTQETRDLADAEDRRPLINDVQISVDDALCMLNTRLSSSDELLNA